MAIAKLSTFESGFYKTMSRIHLNGFGTKDRNQLGGLAFYGERNIHAMQEFLRLEPSSIKRDMIKSAVGTKLNGGIKTGDQAYLDAMNEYAMTRDNFLKTWGGKTGTNGLDQMQVLEQNKDLNRQICVLTKKINALGLYSMADAIKQKGAIKAQIQECKAKIATNNAYFSGEFAPLREKLALASELYAKEAVNDEVCVDNNRKMVALARSERMSQLNGEFGLTSAEKLSKEIKREKRLFPSDDISYLSAELEDSIDHLSAEKNFAKLSKPTKADSLGMAFDSYEIDDASKNFALGENEHLNSGSVL